MPELPRQKKSLDDFNRIADQPQGIHHGLLQDAKNIWNRVLMPAAILNNPEEMKTIDPGLADRMRDKLYQTLPSYREYLERQYSFDAVEAIVSHPGSEPENIQSHDALIKEFNALIERGALTPERALDIYERAMKLFGE